MSRWLKPEIEQELYEAELAREGTLPLQKRPCQKPTAKGAAGEPSILTTHPAAPLFRPLPRDVRSVSAAEMGLAECISGGIFDRVTRDGRRWLWQGDRWVNELHLEWESMGDDNEWRG